VGRGSSLAPGGAVVCLADFATGSLGWRSLRNAVGPLLFTFIKRPSERNIARHAGAAREMSPGRFVAPGRSPCASTHGYCLMPLLTPQNNNKNNLTLMEGASICVYVCMCVIFSTAVHLHAGRFIEVQCWVWRCLGERFSKKLQAAITEATESLRFQRPRFKRPHN